MGTPLLQAQTEPAMDGFRVACLCKIMGDAGVCQVQAPAISGQTISFLGNGQRHQPCARIDQSVSHLLRFVAGHEHVEQGTDNARPVFPGASCRDREQSVLRPQGIAHVWPLKADTDNAP